MICRNCGKSIPNTAQTCPYCGKSTQGSGPRKYSSFNWGRLIAAAGAVLVLLSAFVPSFSMRPANLDIASLPAGINSWIMIIASIIAIVSAFVRKAELLYPFATLTIGFAHAERISYIINYFKAIDFRRTVIGWRGIVEFYNAFGRQYSQVFLIGFLIMVLSAVFIILKFTVGRFFSKG